MTTQNHAATVAELEAEKRRVSAQLRAARKAAKEAAERARRDALADLGEALLVATTGHLAEASFEVRIEALRRALEDREAVAALAEAVHRLSTREGLEDARLDG